jgi:hypothetical protein
MMGASKRCIGRLRVIIEGGGGRGGSNPIWYTDWLIRYRYVDSDRHIFSMAVSYRPRFTRGDLPYPSRKLRIRPLMPTFPSRLSMRHAA